MAIFHQEGQTVHGNQVQIGHSDAALAAAREEGRQQGRREVLDVVRAYRDRERAWIVELVAEGANTSRAEYVCKVFGRLLADCDALPAEEAPDA